jgi:DNA polymerase-3 subunit gamma/tau
VVEIDAATHGGVDEARRLKEDVGYSPLQSRYKVFIIDEATCSPRRPSTRF